MTFAPNALMRSVAGAIGLALLFAGAWSVPTSANPPRRMAVPRAARFMPARENRPMTRRRHSVSGTGCTTNYGTSGAYFVGVTSASNVAGSLDSAVLSGGLNETCGEYSGIGAGQSNLISAGGSAENAFIGGGEQGTIASLDSFIGAGLGNGISGNYAFIGSGIDNTASGNGSFVGAGNAESVSGNTASGTDAFVGAGTSNTASGNGSFVGAGDSAYASVHSSYSGGGNTAAGTDAFVGAGDGNAASGNGSFVGAGGYAGPSGSSPKNTGNSISSGGTDSFIGSGDTNYIGGGQSFVGAGQSNSVISSQSAIVGGMKNSIEGTNSIVGAGANNGIEGDESAIGAGSSNNVSASNSFIGAGVGNSASGGDSFIGAGASNSVSTTGGFLGAGFKNSLTGEYGSILGGGENTASGEYSSVLGGFNNVASGTYAIVAGGDGDTAAGTLSFAAGYHADATHSGSFVWSDYSSGSAAIKDTAANQFIVRASGGIHFLSNEGGTSGEELNAGSGTWASLSDRNAKRDIAAVDDASILARVDALPIDTWQYASENGVRHIGPMAQDFYDAFGVGADDRHITSIDEDGVALAAIKALHRENSGLAHQRALLVKRLAALEAKIDALPQTATR